MPPIVIASFNRHKLHEFSLIAPDFDFRLPQDFGIDPKDAFEEEGTSFFENALGKARRIHQLLRERRGTTMPVIADDSGICVPALGGAPGIHSARYAADRLPPAGTDAERNAVLLADMEGQEDRRVYYVCCLLLYLDSDRFFCAQERWDGILAHSPSSGGTGFGYDPIVRIGSKVVADMTEEEKARSSHRARAFSRLRPLFHQDSGNP